MRGRRSRTLLVGAVVVAVVSASCGSGSKSSSPPASGTTATTAPSAPVSKTLGVGVTASTIKLGFVLIDYNAVKQYIHNTDGNQEQTYRVFVNDINQHGGILGRKIVPEFYTYVSIGSTGPLAACTALTQDQKVFATIGVLYDPTGAGQLCFTNQNHSILITHEVTQAIIAKATPGLMTTVDLTPERTVDVLVSLVKKEGTLKGKTVAILGEPTTKASVTSTIEPAVKALGVKTGDTAIISINGTTDTTAAQAQLDSFIEKWKTEGVNAVVLSGDDVVATQFVEKLRARIPNVTLLTDSAASAMHNAMSEPNPNPYDGMLTAQGLSAQANFEQPSFQACATKYQDAIGTAVIAPADLKPGPDGNKVEVYDAMEVSCEDLAFFKYVAEKVGPYLDNANWTRTMNSLGAIDNVIPGTPFASIHAGKYDASDTAGLASYDPTIEDFKLVTPLLNVRG